MSTDLPALAAEPLDAAPDLFVEFEDDTSGLTAATPPTPVEAVEAVESSEAPEAPEAPEVEAAADPYDEAADEPRALADPPDPALDLSQDGPYARYIALSYIKGAGFVDLPARSLSVQETWQLVRDCDKLAQIVAPLGPYRRTKYTPTLPAKTPRRS